MLYRFYNNGKDSILGWDIRSLRGQRDPLLVQKAWTQELLAADRVSAEWLAHQQDHWNLRTKWLLADGFENPLINALWVCRETNFPKEIEEFQARLWHGQPQEECHYFVRWPLRKWKKVIILQKLIYLSNL